MLACLTHKLLTTALPVYLHTLLHHQLHTVTSAVTSVSVAAVDLSVANDTKALGVVLDICLTFRKHATAVA